MSASPAPASVLNALAEGPRPLLDLLTGMFTAIEGVASMTMLARVEPRQIMRRIASSDIAHFPLGGFDPIDDSPWCRRILIEQRPILGNTPQEMTAFIPETADLVAIGLEAITCVPMVIGGVTRGSVNLMGPAHTFSPKTLAAVEALMPLAALVFVFADVGEI